MALHISVVHRGSKLPVIWYDFSYLFKNLELQVLQLIPKAWSFSLLRSISANCRYSHCPYRCLIPFKGLKHIASTVSHGNDFWSLLLYWIDVPKGCYIAISLLRETDGAHWLHPWEGRQWQYWRLSSDRLNCLCAWKIKLLKKSRLQSKVCWKWERRTFDRFIISKDNCSQEPFIKIILC